MKTLFRAMAASLILAVGCGDVVIEQPTPNEPTKKPIKFNITRNADVTFEGGDKAGFYVVDSYNYGKCFVDNGELEYYNSTWNSEEELYWDEACELADVYCYIPYADVYNRDSHNFSISTEQNEIDNYKNSDFLWGEAKYIDPTDPDSDRVELEMKHLMSRVVITLEPGKGFSEEELLNADVRIETANNVAEINLLNGEIKCNGFGEAVRPYHNYDGDGKYYAVLVPQTIQDMDFITITTTAGKEYKLHQDYMEMAPGKQYNCTLTLNKNSYGIDIGITDWEVEDQDFGGTLN